MEVLGPDTVVALIYSNNASCNKYEGVFLFTLKSHMTCTFPGWVTL